MNVFPRPRDEAPVEEGFSGIVQLASAAEAGIVVASVRVPAGVRTDWHHHTGGQLLVVRSGLVVVANDRQQRSLSAGESVWCPPGEQHWHGAGAPGTVWETYTFGDTIWSSRAAREGES